MNLDEWKNDDGIEPHTKHTANRNGFALLRGKLFVELSISTENLMGSINIHISQLQSKAWQTN